MGKISLNRHILKQLFQQEDAEGLNVCVNPRVGLCVTFWLENWNLTTELQFRFWLSEQPRQDYILIPGMRKNGINGFGRSFLDDPGSGGGLGEQTLPGALKMKVEGLFPVAFWMPRPGVSATSSSAPLSPIKPVLEGPALEGPNFSFVNWDGRAGGEGLGWDLQDWALVEHQNSHLGPLCSRYSSLHLFY